MKTDIRRTKKSFLMLLLIGVWTWVSCTDNFRDYNTDDHKATNEMLTYDNLKTGGFFPRMQRDVIPVSDEGANEYQRAQNLAGDVFSGYMGAIGVWNSGSNNTTYNLGFDIWNDVAFDVGFTKVMPAWKKVADELEDDENSIVYALAQVLKVAAMHRLTDIYGPLPYLRFGHSNFATPYDTQEDIYASFFTDLDEAIGIIADFVEKTPSARPLKKFDLVYGGDFSKWLKFANSLKLRLAMRTVYVTPELSRQYAEEAVAAGVMEVNTGNANLASANGISVFHPLKKCWDDYSDVRMGANMESFLTGYSDSRIDKYFRPSTMSDGKFHGVRNGIRVGNKDRYLPFSVLNIEANTPVQWMCAAEIYFLRAEGALRGWNMQGTTVELYNQGVKTSFEQWNAQIGNYLSDATSKPAAYADPVVASNNIQSGDRRLSTITIAWEESDTFERKLERIITQKWLAVFPDGQEAWSEFRRTGYPKVFPVAVNYSGNTINTDIQVRRIIFPKSEYNNNEAEVRKAVELLGGADTGGTKLWWDKK